MQHTKAIKFFFKPIALIATVVLLLVSCKQHQQSMTITFVGDVILDRGVNDQIQLHGDDLLVNTLRQFKHNDFFIINHEGTFTTATAEQQRKYNFKTDEKNAAFLRQGGVTHVSIANNHINDFGQEGMNSTLAAIRSNQLNALGATCQPTILRKGNSECAILAASLTSHNEVLCISSIDKLKTSISDFVNQKPDIPLLLYIHWGLELQARPEPWQQLLAKDLIELGVDAIIGHHPHVIQTIEYIDEKPVFYSLGNFIADAYLPETDIALSVQFSITDKVDDIRISPLKIERYFPRLLPAAKQSALIRQTLRHSEQVCAFQTDNAWQLKPAAHIDFTEKTTEWYFAQDGMLAAIKKLNEKSYLFNIVRSNLTSNTINLHGQLSALQIADIDNNGSTDVILGISKKVRFDPVEKKRINIYSFHNQNLQPLWLGTKFIYDITSFGVLQEDGGNYLTTLETDTVGNQFQGIYEWDDFGFALNQLTEINTDENQ